MNSFRTNLETPFLSARTTQMLSYSFDVSYVLVFVFKACNSQSADLC